MIDTDKYEGHLAHLEYELWAFTDFMNINATHEERRATYALLNDAPLLLAEVKRLREVAYRKDMQVGERDREVKRLREAALKAREVLMKHYEWMSMNDATSEEDDQEILDTVKQLREASE